MNNPIRIIFVIDSMTSGGAERVLSVLANEFLQLDYDITIISKSHTPSFYPLDEKVNMIYPKNEISRKNKIATFFTRLQVSLNIFNILKKEKPDLVIPFSTTTNGPIILICKLLKLKVIACEHNNYKLNINSLPIKLIKRWIYPLANSLTVLTERDRVQYYNNFMRNVVEMPNPLPLKPLYNFESLPKRELVLLAVGNVSRWKHKGFDTLLNIFSEVVDKNQDWKLKIAGGGDPSYLNEIISNLELSENVELLGETKNIQELMQKYSIYVLSSRWEGLPMVLIEAMSQGMACIAFDCFTGPGDVLTNGKDGVLVEDQNVEKFIDELNKLIESETVRDELGLNAIETSNKYLPEKIVAKWQSLIEHVLKES